MSEAIIIIGTGLAGYNLAKNFRRLDTTTSLILITADDGQYYSKPTLSTALTQNKTVAELAIASPETMAEQLNAQIYVHTEVINIDTNKQEIKLDDATVLGYGKLVLACGAVVNSPPISGEAATDTITVNNLNDYANLQRQLANKKHITIIGAGLIGCEFANDLTNAGYSVSVVAPDKTPLMTLLPTAAGKALQQALTANGVDWHLNKVVKEITQQEKKYQLSLSDQTILETDLVISATGLHPNIKLAQESSLAVNRGVVVNRLLETSVKNIYSLGDCAEVDGYNLLFVLPLMACARALANTLAGEPTTINYPAMPITIKTPSCPLVVAPPAAHINGDWEITGADNNLTCLFYDAAQQLCGFVLMGTETKQRVDLTKQLPRLLS